MRREISERVPHHPCLAVAAGSYEKGIFNAFCALASHIEKNCTVNMEPTSDVTVKVSLPSKCKYLKIVTNPNILLMLFKTDFTPV